MIKTDNLYAEVVINESPFYYDDNGRLRVRVLNEEQSLNELSMRGPENAQMTYFSPNSPEVKKAAEKKPMAPVEKTDMPEPPVRSGGPAKQKPGLGKIIGGIKRPGIGGIARPMPAKKPDNDDGMMRTADMQDRDLDGTDDRDQKPTGGLKKLPAKPGMESGLKKLPAPAKPGMGEKKPLRSFRFSKGSVAGAGKNTNTRAGLRGVKSADRAMMEDSRPATDYIEEKMNLKTAEMGDVIRDFQQSDAPQFKGKSKEKRRIMAIAAKLQAERGE